MRPRSTDEPGRASTPLELLFDLTFVVAISRAVIEFADYIAHGDGVEGIVPFLAVFFAIWWAWMNFTWFASAYDTDDVLYRLLTMVQMGGVLLLAAGVRAAFVETDYFAVTLGYFVMRFALVLQWLRAARGDPAGRATALRFALGIVVLQLGWWGRLFLPDSFDAITFPVLVLLELSVAVWAERNHRTTWHPHHIAERYGLFTIILLGESVLAATSGVQGALEVSGVSGQLAVVALASIVLLFALWWLYFLEPAGEGLEQHPQLSYFWGYGHYFVFVALAAVGSGLEVAVEAAAHPVEGSPVGIGYAVALPVAVFLIMLWALHAPLVPRLVIRPTTILLAAVLVLLLPMTVGTLGLTGVVAGVALVCAAVIAVTIADNARREARSAVDRESADDRRMPSA